MVKTATLQDGPQNDASKGIPPQNLTSLKAFLQTKRPHETESMKHSGVKIPDDCMKLPEPIQAELRKFFASLSTLRTKPDGNPRQEWKIFYAVTWPDALKKAHRAAKAAEKRIKEETNGQRPIGWDDGMDHARTTAEWAAHHQSSRSKQYNAITEAVRAAKPKFVKERGIFWDDLGFMDGELLGKMILVMDLDFEKRDEYLEYARRRFEVWQKGYMLLGDVGGVLYVLCEGKPRRQ